VGNYVLGTAQYPRPDIVLRFDHPRFGVVGSRARELKELIRVSNVGPRPTKHVRSSV